MGLADVGRQYLSSARSLLIFVTSLKHRLCDLQAAGLLDFIAAASPTPSVNPVSASEEMPGAAAIPCPTDSMQLPTNLSSPTPADAGPCCPRTRFAMPPVQVACSSPQASAEAAHAGESSLTPSASLLEAPACEPDASHAFSLSAHSIAGATAPLPACTSVPCGEHGQGTAYAASSAAVACQVAERSADLPAPAAGRCQKLRSNGKTRRRRLGRDRRKRGLTPDHMLYWLLHMQSLGPEHQQEMPLQEKDVQAVAVTC